MDSRLRTRLVLMDVVAIVVLVAASVRFSIELTPGYTELVPAMAGIVGILLVNLVFLLWKR